MFDNARVASLKLSTYVAHSAKTVYYKKRESIYNKGSYYLQENAAYRNLPAGDVMSLKLRISFSRLLEKVKASTFKFPLNTLDI